MSLNSKAIIIPFSVKCRGKCWQACHLGTLQYVRKMILELVGSVKVIFFSSHYRADKSTISGMRGLWGLTINSGRGATLKYLKDGHKSNDKKMATFLGRKVITSASILLRKA